MGRYAVVDCETTGFGVNDRVIEIAIVLLDGTSLEVIDEFDTLLNPGRDVGRTDLHGISPKMIGAAPRFEDIASSLAARLHGSVLVAHNISFDARMLQQECDRFKIKFDRGNGVCTYKLSGSKLDVAIQSLGIELDHHHRALADARAASDILRHFRESIGSEIAVKMHARASFTPHHTLRREAVESVAQPSTLRRMLGRACYPSSNDRVATYFEMLDWALSDGRLSADEKRLVQAARSELGLSSQHTASLHGSYLKSIKAAILRDGRVTDDEAKLFSKMSRMLGLGDAKMEVTASVPADASIRPGCRVCFTGAAIDTKGEPIERADLEIIAAARGFQPVKSVTKKGCDLLVAEDSATMSSKGQIAQKWGIPIMSVQAFITLYGT